MTNLCDFFQNIWVLNEVLSLNAQESDIVDESADDDLPQ